MFIGREKELNSLNKLYDSDKFEFVVLMVAAASERLSLSITLLRKNLQFTLWALKATKSRI